MKKKMCYLVIMICLACLPGILLAATLHDSLYQNPNEVEFFLHTTDVGNRVYDNYGHVAIRVVDKKNHSDLVYNWGVFDFSNPFDFTLNFYRDILWYKLGIAPFKYELMRYKWEKRRVLQERINLTIEQKIVLIDILKWNAKPENLRYQYQYFFDNCSTRPRDYLDKALGGRIRQWTEKEKLRESFRDMVMSHNATLPGIDTGLDILMNSNIDKKMTLWEKAFLPKTLRNILLTMKSDVSEVDGPLPLISDGTLIIDVPAATPSDNFSFCFLLYGVLLPTIIAIFGAFIPWQKWRFFTARAELLVRLSFRIIGIVTIIFGIYTGIVGVAMPLNWWLSGHVDLHHNVNILIFWPVDFLLVVFGWHWLRRGDAFRLAHRYRKWLQFYSLVHIFVTIFVGLFWFFDGTDQYIGRVVTYFVPISVLIFGFLALRGLAAKN